MEIVLRCTTCYPVRLADCPDNLVFNLAIDPNTTYDYTITDSMGNTYEGTTTTDNNGNISISTTSDPFDTYPGLFNKFAGSFKLTLFDNNGDAVSFTVNNAEYTCITFSMKDTVELDACGDEITCGCILGGYAAPSDLYGKDGDFYIDNGSGVIWEKISGTWTVFYVPEAGITDGDYGDITVSNSGATWTIDNEAVTFAKIQHIATDKLLGRHSAGNGNIQEIGLDGGVEFQGGKLKAKVTNSVEIDNQNIQLKNDSATPGNDKYYGTDAGGTKGFHSFPASGITQLTGEVTAGPGSGSQAATIANDAVTFAKMQNIATDRLLGRDTAGSGDVEELTVGGGIEFTSGGGIQTSALTGDVTKTAGGTATTIANDAVTFAKMQNIDTSKILGRSTAGNGDIEELTAAQVISLLNVPSKTQTDFISGIIEIPSDTTYKVVVKIPYGITITETTTISASGTCTATFKINTTALGGTANSVSNSEQSQTHSSNNVAAADDDIQITISSNSACSFLSFTIKFTRTLA